MPFKYIIAIALSFLSPHIKSEQSYVQLLAERHAAVFISARERLIHLMRYANPSAKEKLNSTRFKIGSFDKFDQCGIQSMYSTYDHGIPVIVYCPTGYRLAHDFGEGYAYINVYLTGLGIDAVGVDDLALSFMKEYHNYLSLAAFSIITRNINQAYPKLCDPLLFVYLFVHKLTPSNCIAQADKYNFAVRWMYEDESYGAITEEKLRRNLPFLLQRELNYSKKLRNKFITDMRGHAQAGQWFGQLFHEFFHIMNGDLDRPSKSPAENKERELRADEFAIKMMVLDDPDSSLLRLMAYNATQLFSAALINSEDFETRLKLSFLESMELIKKNKDSFPREIYERIMTVYEARCENSECAPYR